MIVARRQSAELCLENQVLLLVWPVWADRDHAGAPLSEAFASLLPRLSQPGQYKQGVRGGPQLDRVGRVLAAGSPVGRSGPCGKRPATRRWCRENQHSQ